MHKEPVELTINNKTFKVMKLHGEGQCSCYGCEQKTGWNRIWTDFCYEYKGHIYCFQCIEEVLKNEQ